MREWIVIAAIVGVLSLSGCESKPPNPAARASVTIEADSSGCDPDHPIAVHVENVSDRQIDGVEMVILGQNEGHSTYLANSGSIRTDKILQKGEVDSFCYERPTVIRAAPADVKWKYTVEVRDVWGGQDS